MAAKSTVTPSYERWARAVYCLACRPLDLRDPLIPPSLWFRLTLHMLCLFNQEAIGLVILFVLLGGPFVGYIHYSYRRSEICTEEPDWVVIASFLL